MINLNLKFGGFYGSIHEDNIDSMLDSYFMDEDGEIMELNNYDINYRLLHEEYSKNYLDIFEEWMQDEYFKSTKLHFIRLDSPTYYNYKTDEISLRISNDLEKKLFHKLVNNKDFLEWLKEHTKSSDGYISYYNYFEVLESKDHIFSSFALNYLVELFNDEDFFKYYDLNNSYELVYNLDFYREIEKGA